MKSISIAVLFFFILLMEAHLKAQKWRNESFGVQLGLSASLGSHVQRIGVRIQSYYTIGFVQINAGNHFAFNIKNSANRSNFISNRISLGLIALAGKKNSHPHFIFDGLFHQTKHQYGLGYNYIWYLDNAKSAQRSAGIGIHAERFSLLIENDFFAVSKKDRFRTSHIALLYRTETLALSVNSQLWTGETGGTQLQNTTDSIYTIGYKDLSETLYGRESHGILAFSVDYLIGYGNRASATAGIDHERIRNVLQNQLSHEKIFLPDWLGKRYVCYPMLDKNGLPVHQKGLEREGRFYSQLEINRSLTY